MGALRSSVVRRSKGSQEGINFWPSFADLCVAFTLFWILIVIISIVTPAFSDGVVRRSILELVKKTMNESLPASQQNLFEVNTESATIQLKDTDIFFDSGSARLKEEGASVVSALSKGLLGALDEHGEKIDTIIIEGYADIAPIGKTVRRKYPTNWELSTARASSVLRQIVEGKVEDIQILRKFSAAGYGDSRAVSRDVPLASDRRIEIRILTRNQKSNQI